MSSIEEIECIETLKAMMDSSEDLEYRRMIRAKIRKIKKNEQSAPGEGAKEVKAQVPYSYLRSSSISNKNNKNCDNMDNKNHIKETTNRYNKINGNKNDDNNDNSRRKYNNNNREIKNGNINNDDKRDGREFKERSFNKQHSLELNINKLNNNNNNKYNNNSDDDDNNNNGITNIRNNKNADDNNKNENSIKNKESNNDNKEPLTKFDLSTTTTKTKQNDGPFSITLKATDGSYNKNNNNNNRNNNNNNNKSGMMERIELKKVEREKNKEPLAKSRRTQNLTPRQALKVFKMMDKENESDCKNKAINQNTIRDKILNWCRNRLSGYENVELMDFSSSWSDGLAFCALANSYFPYAFDYDALDRKNRRQNFQLAFQTLEDKAGVTQLLEVDDMLMTSQPDWKCVFTYVNSIIARMNELKKEEEAN